MNFNWDELAGGLEDGAVKVKELVTSIEENQEPIKAGIDLFKMIVDSKTEGVSIDNDTVISLLETIARSTANGLDDNIIDTVKVALKIKF